MKSSSQQKCWLFARIERQFRHDYLFLLFWCFELLEVRKTIIFEPFVEWQKRSKGVQAFATDSEPLKGSSDCYTMQKPMWNTFRCRFSKVSEKVFTEVFATLYKHRQGFVCCCTFLNAFSVFDTTFFFTVYGWDFSFVSCIHTPRMPLLVSCDCIYQLKTDAAQDFDTTQISSFVYFVRISAHFPMEIHPTSASG